MKNSAAMYAIAKTMAIDKGPIHVHGEMPYVGYGLTYEQIKNLYKSNGFDVTVRKEKKNAMERHLETWSDLAWIFPCIYGGERLYFMALDRRLDAPACYDLERKASAGETMIGVATI